MKSKEKVLACISSAVSHPWLAAFMEQNFSISVLSFYRVARNFVCNNMQHFGLCRDVGDVLACWLIDFAVVQTCMVKLTEGACIPPAGLDE